MGIEGDSNVLDVRIENDCKIRMNYSQVFLKDAQVLIGIWHQHDNTVRLHSSTDYTPPPHPAVLPLFLGICRLHYLKL
jgi:hypothetical protein